MLKKAKVSLSYFTRRFYCRILQSDFRKTLKPTLSLYSPNCQSYIWHDSDGIGESSLSVHCQFSIFWELSVKVSSLKGFCFKISFKENEHVFAKRFESYCFILIILMWSNHWCWLYRVCNRVGLELAFSAKGRWFKVLF